MHILLLLRQWHRSLRPASLHDRLDQLADAQGQLQVNLEILSTPAPGPAPGTLPTSPMQQKILDLLHEQTTRYLHTCPPIRVIPAISLYLPIIILTTLSITLALLIALQPVWYENPWLSIKPSPPSLPSHVTNPPVPAPKPTLRWLEPVPSTLLKPSLDLSVSLALDHFTEHGQIELILTHQGQPISAVTYALDTLPLTNSNSHLLQHTFTLTDLPLQPGSTMLVQARWLPASLTSQALSSPPLWVHVPSPVPQSSASSDSTGPTQTSPDILTLSQGSAPGSTQGRTAPRAASPSRDPANPLPSTTNSPQGSLHESALIPPSAPPFYTPALPYPLQFITPRDRSAVVAYLNQLSRDFPPTTPSSPTIQP
ncbi:MAG: hypothetical protein HC898_09585 [Phycisphaerales bacterium]|nr:hypothetical protein [Phycisphaerales bacterium]